MEGEEEREGEGRGEGGRGRGGEKVMSSILKEHSPLMEKMKTGVLGLFLGGGQFLKDDTLQGLPFGNPANTIYNWVFRCLG